MSIRKTIELVINNSGRYITPSGLSTLILILVMVAAMTVGIFRMMHADKK